MDIKDYLFEVPLEWFVEESYLESEAIDLNGYEPFVDPKTGNVFNDWLIKKSGWYSKRTKKYYEQIFKCELKPRYYFQKAGFELPMHQDRGTMCSLNIVIGSDYDPITFETFTHSYKSAILNTQKKHSVKATKDRYIYKLSIFDISYEEAVKRYIEYQKKI